MNRRRLTLFNRAPTHQPERGLCDQASSLATFFSFPLIGRLTAFPRRELSIRGETTLVVRVSSTVLRSLALLILRSDPLHRLLSPIQHRLLLFYVHHPSFSPPERTACA